MNPTNLPSSTPPGPASKTQLWVGWILSVLPVLMVAMSAVMKLTKAPGLAEGFAHLGWPLDLAVGLGVIELGCAAVYIFPRTSVLGAILLTGFLGGAIATTARVGDKSWWLIILLIVFVWGGLYLRNPRLRALIPLTR